MSPDEMMTIDILLVALLEDTFELRAMAIDIADDEMIVHCWSVHLVDMYYRLKDLGRTSLLMPGYNPDQISRHYSEDLKRGIKFAEPHQPIEED